MTKNEKREAAKTAAAAALRVFAEVTVANWTDAELLVQVGCYSISSPRNKARRIVEAAAAARNLV